MLFRSTLLQSFGDLGTGPHSSSDRKAFSVPFQAVLMHEHNDELKDSYTALEDPFLELPPLCDFPHTLRYHRGLAGNLEF